MNRLPRFLLNYSRRLLVTSISLTQEFRISIIPFWETLPNKNLKRFSPIINEQLKNTIKPLCPVLMKGVVENLNKRVPAS